MGCCSSYFHNDTYCFQIFKTKMEKGVSVSALEINMFILGYVCGYLLLSVTSHINCIVTRCLINVVYLRHVPLSGHDGVAVFE